MGVGGDSLYLLFMEQLQFNQFKVKKESRYDLIESIAKRLNKDIGQLLGLTKGISHQDLIKILQSVEALSRDKNMDFGKSFWWHLREIRKYWS